MKTTTTNATVKKMMQKIEKGDILFTHCVQRKENQWGLDKKSLLVHSLLAGLPVPPVYSYCEDDEYQVLDGKQRLTTLKSYIKDEFTLENVPKVTVENEDYDVNGLKFSELEESLRDEITGFNILMYTLENATDEEVAEVFFRLNNGCSLTKNQQTRAKLGMDLINFTDDILKLPLFKEKANFTKLQILKSEDEACILQALLLLKDFKYKKLNADDVLKFVEYYKEVCTQQELQEYKNLFMKLDECFDNKNKLLKKMHVPMFILALKTSEEMEIPFNTFKDWINDFVDNYNSKNTYGELCSGHTTNKEVVSKRIELINNSLMEYAIGGAE